MGGTAGPAEEEDAEYMSQAAPSQMSLLGSPSLFTARRQALPAHPQEGVVPLTDLAPEPPSSSAAARSQLEGSQPVSTFRRPAARSGHTSSAFLRYAEDGEEEEEEEEEQIHVVAQSGHTHNNNSNSNKSGAEQAPRRKRFLDEASDDD